MRRVQCVQFEGQCSQEKFLINEFLTYFLSEQNYIVSRTIKCKKNTTKVKSALLEKTRKITYETCFSFSRQESHFLIFSLLVFPKKYFSKYFDQLRFSHNQWHKIFEKHLHGRKMTSENKFHKRSSTLEINFCIEV